MRTLMDIIESAQDGHMPTHEECYWAMLAMEGLRHFDHMAVMALCDKDITPRVLEFRRAMEYEESFRRTKLALSKDPKSWVGPEHDPSNPEVQKRRDMAFKVAEKATGINFREPTRPSNTQEQE